MPPMATHRHGNPMFEKIVDSAITKPSVITNSFKDWVSLVLRDRYMLSGATMVGHISTALSAGIL